MLGISPGAVVLLHRLQVRTVDDYSGAISAGFNLWLSQLREITQLERSGFPSLYLEEIHA